MNNTVYHLEIGGSIRTTRHDYFVVKQLFFTAIKTPINAAKKVRVIQERYEYCAGSITTVLHLHN